MHTQNARLWFASALLPQGWVDDVRVIVTEGGIERIESSVVPGARDERHAIAVPGMPNLHSHAFQRAMAGLAETRDATGSSFWTWRDLMYRFVDTLSADDIEAIAAYAYVEMLESGFTRVGEFHYLHHAPDGAPYSDPAELCARIAAAASDAGIALTLLPVFYAHSGFGGAAAKHEQRRFIHDIDGFARLMEGARRVATSLPDGRVGVAPHSLRAVTPAELDAVAGLTANGPIHIHIAEQTGEVEDCIAWCGRRPVEWLLDHADVDARWCLVHATHLSSEEAARLASSDAVAGLCPVTEANLGDGLFPAESFMRAGGRFGIGSDSNVLIDAAAELRLLEYGQRLQHRARSVLALETGQSTGRRLFEAACSGGAQALDGGAPGITESAPADIVSLHAAHPSLIERRGDAMLDSWIFAGGSGLVDCVWRHGRKLVEGGRHHARSRIADRYARTLRQLLS
ncbi:MAG: formimidoylglutamate deiminase [Steroidobacteraceae bacterium]